MPLDVPNIRTAMSRNAEAGREPRWRDLVRELTAATVPPVTPHVERLLLEVLRFEGELQLDESADMPHRMSPEDMLKSLAAQALGRLTGAAFLPTLRRLLLTTSPALACMIRGVIQQATSAKRLKPAAETVAVGWGDSEAIPLTQHGGMTHVRESSPVEVAPVPGTPNPFVTRTMSLAAA